MQRRQQKIIEEAPAPALPDAVRDSDRGILRGAGPRMPATGALGTVEFLYDLKRMRLHSSR